MSYDLLFNYRNSGDEIQWLNCVQKYATRNNVNLPIDFGLHTPTYLHIAARRNFSTAAVWLIEECGANVNAYDKVKETPLFDAVRNSSVSVLHMLLRHGAKVNYVNNGGIGPLACALQTHLRTPNVIKYSAKEETVIRKLIDYGAKPDLADEHKVPKWIKNREKCRQVCVIILGIRSQRLSVLNKNVKDITQIIAKQLWETRVMQSWE